MLVISAAAGYMKGPPEGRSQLGGPGTLWMPKSQSTQYFSADYSCHIIWNVDCDIFAAQSGIILH